MKFISSFLVYILFTLNAWAQGPVIKGRFIQVPFEKFAEEIENRTPVRFYYLKESTRDILINAEGENLDLQKILREHLSGSDLSFVFLDGKRIIITKGLPPVTRLPDYSLQPGAPGGDGEEKDNRGLTQAEKLYIEGRKASPVQTLYVGEAGGFSEGQTSVVYGLIGERETGQPLIGATIYIEELSKGLVTDINGHYTLTVPSGTYTMRISCLGMEELNYRLEVRSGGILNLQMEKKLYPIDEIVVKSSSHHNVRGTQMGFSQISIKNIKEIPMVMGEKDVLNVVHMLPGVQTSGEGSAGIQVRGSSTDQNMFLLNRIPVYNTSHLFGFFSVFNPDIIQDFSFYKSNLPAKYGGRLSSVIDITGRQGSNKKFTARGGLSPITAHLAVEGPVRKDKSSFIISARSMYSDWILDRINLPAIRESDPHFYDLAGGVNIRQNDRNLIKVFGYFSKDRYNLTKANQYQYSNAGGSVNWWHMLSPSLNTDISAIFSQYRFQHNNLGLPLEAYRQNYSISHSELKTDFLWVPFDRHKIAFGGNAILYNLDRGEILPYGPESLRNPVKLGEEQGIEGALYLSDQIQVTDRLTITAGLRYSLFSNLGPREVHLYPPDNPVEPEFVIDTVYYGRGESTRFYSGPEWRVALNQLLGNNNSVKFSYNKTRQYLFMLSNTQAMSPTDQWKLSDYHISPSMADQFSLGYYHDLRRGDINLSAEVYYKMADNIVDYKDGADFISSPNMETQILNGIQRAYGIELMMRKNAGNWTGWMSMTYSRTKLKVDGENSWDRINRGNWYPANYDVPVALNGVMNYRVNRRLSMSGNLVYHTGRPVTYPVGSFKLEDKKYIIYSSRNEYRIPDYFRMDLSVNIEGNLRAHKLGHSYWMIGVYNLTGRKNAYSVFFKIEDNRINGYKLSIFAQPVVTLSWNFKFGNYASD